MVEVLKQQIFKRDGNDCLLTDAIALIKITYDLYIVTYTSAVDGGWTGSLGETNSYTFRDMKPALDIYNKLCKTVN